METPALAPPTSPKDGLYDLAQLVAVEPSPSPSPSPAAMPEINLTAPARAPATNAAAKPEPAKVQAAAGPGLFGRLFARGTTPAKPPEAPAPETKPEAPAPAKPRPSEPAGPKLRRKKTKRSWRYDAPAWAVSALMHLGLLGALAVVAVSAEGVIEKKPIDLAPFDPKLSEGQAEELVHVYADPAAVRSEQLGESSATPGVTTGLGTGTGPPSATPRVSSNASGPGEGALPQVKVVANLSPLSHLPTASPSKDFGLRGGGAAGGGASGDVTMGTKDVGEALDQLAREILRHLAAHKLTVIWLFDESGSMKDDQRAVKDKFGRVASELKLNLPEEKKGTTPPLNHVVIGFGESLHPEIAKPTADVAAIGRAIDRLPVDPSGIEKTNEAIARVVNEYAKQMKDGRRMLLVLVTDESGDDGQSVEEAHQALTSHGVPLYVIGRQSLFGYDRAHLLYTDPVTKENYWPEIKRGPESADRETLQIDGLHERWDEQPSGFAPFELARLAKDSGGIYFLLPSEENMRVRQREKAYSIATLKEYVPSYTDRASYMARREKSDLGRLLTAIIQETSKDYVHRRGYSIDPAESQKEILEEVPRAQERLKRYMAMEQRLKAAKPLRDREPDKRWQAHYDLMLGQIVAYEVKAYEYLACLDEMADLMRKGQLKPSKMPIKDQLTVNWVINHSQRQKAPKAETEKKYAEAKQLLQAVIKNHPNTPWADLAQDEMNRGFGCQRDEEHHGPGYAERARLVPKY